MKEAGAIGLAKKSASLILENREKMTLSGVTDVDSFNEQQIVLFTTLGELVIKGRMLHINSVNVDTGDAEIVGEIRTVSYTDKRLTKKPGAVKRLFR